MKISLFIRPSLLKAYVSLIIIVIIICQPSSAYAGFFSDFLTKIILGNKTQAAEITPPVIADSTANTFVSTESLNPDIIESTKQSAPVVVNSNSDTLLSSDGSLGSDNNLEKYDSSTKIFTYTVVKGDTLSGIAEKLKISQSTILDSNTDLKKSDLLKVGQNLVIIGLKADLITNIQKSAKEKTKKPTKPIVEKKAQEPVNKSVETTQTPEVSTDQKPTPENTDTNIGININTNNNTNTGSTNSSNSKVIGGYIWPFPKGIGRISQTLHADDAYDFAAPLGTPIFAVQNGKVLVVHPTGYNGGFGRYVVIDFDDGRQAIFAHMTRTVAKVGEIVKQGEVIGYVGSTGHSTGPHTHIGFHGSLGNPYIALKKGDTSDSF